MEAVDSTCSYGNTPDAVEANDTWTLKAKELIESGMVTDCDTLSSRSNYYYAHKTRGDAGEEKVADSTLPARGPLSEEEIRQLEQSRSAEGSKWNVDNYVSELAF